MSVNKNLFDNNERILFKPKVIRIMILDRIKQHRYHDRAELEENLKLVIEEFHNWVSTLKHLLCVHASSLILKL